MTRMEMEQMDKKVRQYKQADTGIFEINTAIQKLQELSGFQGITLNFLGPHKIFTNHSPNYEFNERLKENLIEFLTKEKENLETLKEALWRLKKLI